MSIEKCGFFSFGMLVLGKSRRHLLLSYSLRDSSPKTGCFGATELLFEIIGAEGKTLSLLKAQLRRLTQLQNPASLFELRVCA